MVIDYFQLPDYRELEYCRSKAKLSSPIYGLFSGQLLPMSVTKSLISHQQKLWIVLISLGSTNPKI